MVLKFWSLWTKSRFATKSSSLIGTSTNSMDHFQWWGEITRGQYPQMERQIIHRSTAALLEGWSPNSLLQGLKDLRTYSSGPSHGDVQIHYCDTYMTLHWHYIYICGYIYTYIQWHYHTCIHSKRMNEHMFVSRYSRYSQYSHSVAISQYLLLSWYNHNNMEAS